MPMKKKWIVYAAVLLVPCLILVALSVILTGTTGLAWFIKNRQTDESGLKTQVDYDDIEMSTVFYKYNIKNAAAAEYGDISEIAFNAYDDIFKSKNQYSSILIKITLEGTAISTEGGTLNLIVERDTSLDSENAAGVADHPEYLLFNQTISSTMNFAAIPSVTLDGISDPTALYTAAQTAFASVATQVFTTPVDGTIYQRTVPAEGETTEGGEPATKQEEALNVTKVDSLTLPISYVGANVTDSDSDGKNEVHIYLWVSYDIGTADSPKLINYFANVFDVDGFGSGLTGKVVDVHNDLTYIIVRKPR